MRKPSLDDLNIFIVAANQRSLTATAATLKMTIATVSRRISALEATLGVELLHRSTKGLTLTPQGESYFRECEELVLALDQRISDLDQTLYSLSGPLKVMAPVNLGSGPLDAFWRHFIDRYPEIALTIELDNNVVDIRDHQADIALRSGPQKDSTLIQKHLGYIEPILVASPSMKHPLPSTIKELQACPSVAAKMFSDWLLFHHDGSQHACHKSHFHISNDMNIVLNLTTSGAGVSLMPASMVANSLQAGELIQVLPEWRGRHREIFLVWPYRRSLSARSKVFRSELIEFLSRQSWFHAAD
ncbi:LysR family transcriptional regulator [Vreelandella alkaliphila]|uniref:LysR family transcriptional regulator n=1 Tax=Vreelandella alkaliphila TaxID=272774 RepID=A0AAJ2RRR1_9GAMM|nr:LysR family transcriptional regulator [Halomonas alkaliphila]MDX5977133.1 LysR family transcriptional regulator [Halomonas alkaliphila]